MSNTCQKIEQIISIGGFSVHNQGKIEAQKQGIALTTIPIPLSNDSFGTNRCSINNKNEIKTSFEGKYPNRCIFFINELINFGIDNSLGGIGEFIGLYYSIIDYYTKNKIDAFREVLYFIYLLYSEIISSYKQNEELQYLKKIIQALVFKNLVMRANNDHEIGCGIDHFFAREYEHKYEYNHGKAVYLGAIISSFLFPEWETWGINVKSLIQNGLLLKLISKNDIDNICFMDLCLFTKEALNKRKTRSSMLRYLSDKEIIDKQNRFRNGIYKTNI